MVLNICTAREEEEETLYNAIIGGDEMRPFVLDLLFLLLLLHPDHHEWLRHTEIVTPYSVARRQGCWCGSCLWVQQRTMMLTRCYKERWKTVQDAAGHKTEPLARSPHRFAAKSAEIQRSKTSH